LDIGLNFIFHYNLIKSNKIGFLTLNLELKIYLFWIFAVGFSLVGYPIQLNHSSNPKFKKNAFLLLAGYKNFKNIFFSLSSNQVNKYVYILISLFL
jgi:hypothetical protein